MASKPGTYRPTTLKLAGKHCPRAIDFYHQGAETDRSIFAVGIAVHALIQAVIEATNELDRRLDDDEFDAISLAACKRMIREGRTFEGEPEPPLSPDAVWEGRELARQYVARYPIEPATLSEVGMAVDHDWRPVEYSKAARMRLIADYLTVLVEQDEETAARVLVVRDYKSAWPTDESELRTVQLRAQAVLAFLFHGDDVDCLRQEVVNLRTGATYSRELWLIEDGAEILERWRTEIEATLDALDKSRGSDGLYPVAPGGGCIGCPFLQHCEAGKAWSERALEGLTPEERAVAYLATEARYKELRRVLMTETAERPIRLPGGRLVGRQAKERRQAKTEAWQLLLEKWEEHGGDAGGLLLAIGLGVGQLDKAGKVLFPERADVPARREWVESLVDVVGSQEFGVFDDDQDLMAALRASLAEAEGER